MKQWWAIRVLTGKEYRVKKIILDNYPDSEIYVPRKLITKEKDGKITQKTENLLPGYILINTIHSVNPGLLPGSLFARVIGGVSAEEIDNLKRVEYVEQESIMPGTKIIVTEGPLMGAKGMLVYHDEKCNKSKCKLGFKDLEFTIDIRPDYINSI